MIHYAKSGTVNIAYQVLGAGPPDLLVLSGVLLPIDSLDEEPSLARFHRRLASFSRLIRFDRRGVGMSDPVTPTGPTTLEQWGSDALAVMEAVGCRRTAILAATDSSPQAILLAASFPELVSHLVIVNGTARIARADDYPVGAPQRVLDRFLDVGMAPDALEQGYDQLSAEAPTMARDEAFRAWWDRAGYRGASPAMARAISAVDMKADVRAVLPHLRVPTLILHRRGDSMVRVGHGRYLAEHIPNSRYVELDGADNLYWVGDADIILDEIEEFLTGARSGPSSDRVLATIMFTDIVGSTARLAELGDRRWGEILDRCNAAVRRQLERFRGREVKTTGDGILATFDGPARAVAGALAIRDAAAQLGLDVRVGVHAGEIEVLGTDIGGMAVHIAARVAALAKPGQVLVSRTVVDLTVGSGLVFEDCGQHVLKGVPGRWRLYSVTA